MSKLPPYQLATRIEGKLAIDKRLANFPKKASREIFWVTWRDLEDRTSKIWDGGAHRLGLRLNKAIPYKGSDVEAILVGIQT